MNFNLPPTQDAHRPPFKKNPRSIKKMEAFHALEKTGLIFFSRFMCQIGKGKTDDIRMKSVSKEKIKSILMI